MATQVTNYKCPACTGPLHFVGASGKLECDYCGTSYTVEEIEARYAQADSQAQAASAAAEQKAAKAQREAAAGGWDISATGGEWGAEGQNMRAYTCPSCGAELICDATTAATSCPYCGNPTIVPGQLGGALKPDLVIPFKLSKEQAVAALKNHYRGKRLLPKSFTAANHIQEIKGVYVPFWLFDGAADAEAEFDASRSHSHREGKEEVTVTEHYRVRRAGTVEFERIPVDAASKMPDDYMDSIEPFDYGELKPFSTAYLPGFLADKYDVSIADSATRADERAANSAIQSLAETVSGYDFCAIVQQNVQLRRGQVKYALLPVWMLNSKWQGQDFLFAMNGQTGKLVGDLPVSMGRFWAWFAGIALPVAALVCLILFC